MYNYTLKHSVTAHFYYAYFDVNLTTLWNTWFWLANLGILWSSQISLYPFATWQQFYISRIT